VEAIEPFSVENELATPTFELRRTQLLQKYTPQAGRRQAVPGPLCMLHAAQLSLWLSLALACGTGMWRRAITL
jgi:hypothetical protein